VHERCSHPQKMENQKLACLVCSEEFSSTVEEHQARLLTCEHSFCFGCLRKAHKNGKIPCPACGETTNEANPAKLKINQPIQVALELISPCKTPGAHMCTEECGKYTNTFCSSCPESPPICEECFKITHGTKAKSSHQLKHIGHRKELSSVAKCPEHQESFKLYCYNDYQPCCSLCVSHGSHKGHKTALVPDAVRDIRLKQVTQTLRRIAYHSDVAALVLQKIRHQEQQVHVAAISLNGATKMLQSCEEEKDDDIFLQKWVEAARFGRHVFNDNPTSLLHIDLPISEIISPYVFTELLSLTSRQNAELLYSGTTHGWRCADFHSNCDFKGPTLVVVQDSQGYIFGGYTPIDWRSTKQTSDEDISKTSFLFSVKSPFGNKFKVFRTTTITASVFFSTQDGPIFGLQPRPDLFISDQPQLSNKSRSFLGSYYTTDTENSDYLTGQPTFKVQRLEVYRLNFKP
jgi:hypothetical protein